ncbi:hypothetical protein QJS66_08205 [Kocuria rhizophila]|nr:hypothetical protein QJS66_08205 [Kocuria rhizophila]
MTVSADILGTDLGNGMIGNGNDRDVHHRGRATGLRGRRRQDPRVSSGRQADRQLARDPGQPGLALHHGQEGHHRAGGVLRVRPPPWT